MHAAFALRIFRGKIILYLQAGKIYGFSPLAFSREVVTGNGIFSDNSQMICPHRELYL